MKYLIILLILAGCSKTHVSPGITGHWAFSTSSCSGDFTIVNNAGGYAVAPNGTFAFNGHSYTTGPSLQLVSNGTNAHLVPLRTVVDLQGRATSLQFTMTGNSDYTIVIGGNPITWHEATNQPSDGSFNITSFPVVRK